MTVSARKGIRGTARQVYAFESYPSPQFGAWGVPICRGCRSQVAIWGPYWDYFRTALLNSNLAEIEPLALS